MNENILNNSNGSIVSVDAEVPAADVDLAIIARVVSGERDAFKDIYDRHKGMVYTTCWRYVKNDEEAQDLTQEVFMKALESLGSFKGNSQFGVWLYRIAINHSKNRLKHNKIITFFSIDKKRENDEGEESSIELVDANLNTEQTVDTMDTVNRVHEALLSLEPELREVIELRFLENKSYEEIALACNCPPGTVGSRLSRAHIALRKRVKALAVE